VNRDDVVLNHGRRRAGFAQKALAGRGGRRQMGREHFDRHDAMQRFIERLEHDAKPSLTQYFKHVVLAESANRAGPHGWFEKRQVMRRRAALRSGAAVLCHRGIGGAELLHNVAERGIFLVLVRERAVAFARAQRLQRLLASCAGVEMGRQRVLFSIVEVASQQTLPAVGGGAGGHIDNSFKV
jgi:hypothetical protein